jgi:hypothetical protein
MEHLLNERPILVSKTLFKLVYFFANVKVWWN